MLEKYITVAFIYNASRFKGSISLKSVWKNLCHASVYQPSGSVSRTFLVATIDKSLLSGVNELTRPQRNENNR